MKRKPRLSAMELLVYGAAVLMAVGLIAIFLAASLNGARTES